MDRKIIAKEINDRVKKLQRLLGEHQIHGALIIQKADLYYFTGTDQDAYLWIPAYNDPILMVRKSLERALKDSSIERIVPLTTPSQLPEYIIGNTGEQPYRLGLELDVLPVNLYFYYKRLFPDKEIMDISVLIRRVRMIKSPYEVSFIRKAAEIADNMFRLIPEFIKESKTEIDLELKLEAFVRSQGHPCLARTRSFNVEIAFGHIVAGKSGTVPNCFPGAIGGYGLGAYYSQGAGWGKIRSNEPVLVDYGPNVEGYLSDQTRTFSIGKLHEKFHHALRGMIEVQDHIQQQGKTGVRAGDLYDSALRIVEKQGLSDGFMGLPQPVPFIGHGIGLEVDEWPVIGRGSEHILEKGMVIALEPKYTFPGEGVVGTESTFVITDNGMEKLNSYPDEITIC